MKHARPDYDRFQDPAGKIPADEPVFLLRGQDFAASAAVRCYADKAEELGAEPALVAASRAWADRMEEWATYHGKVPDLSWEPKAGDAVHVAGAQPYLVFRVLGVVEGWVLVAPWNAADRPPFALTRGDVRKAEAPAFGANETQHEAALVAENVRGFQRPAALGAA